MEDRVTTFLYEARASDGRTSKGSITALNAEEALDKLWARSLLVVSLQSRPVTKPAPRDYGGRVSSEDLVIFTRQLATMEKAGLPLAKALGALQRQNKKGGVPKLLEFVIHDIESGMSFSEALMMNPRVFSKLYVNMVRAGEAGGIVPEVLERLAGFLEASLRLRRKIRSAMAYPAVVCLFSIAISIFLVTKIIPVFGEIFMESNAQLPAPTQLLLRFSDFVRHNLLAGVCGLVVAVVAFVMLKRTSFGALVWDNFKLRLPIVGGLVQKVALTRFAQTAAALLRSGVPILSALKTTSQAVGNCVVESALVDTAEMIEHGGDFASAISQHPIFPSMIVEMVAAGELTGNVAEMLQQVAGYYEEQVETALNGLTALIEPLLIAFLGTIIGTIVLCMFLPLFKLSQIVQF
jgi:type IV pilus assembly protein PilC